MTRWTLASPVIALSIAVAAACGSYGGGPYAGAGPAGVGNAGAPPTTTPPGNGANDAGPTAAPTPTPTPAPPVAQPPPATATYARGSLKTLFQLLPRTEYGRVKNQGVAFQDSDYESNAVTTSVAAKLDDVAALVSSDTGTPTDLIPDSSDRQRAELIPFRGKPTDVKVVNVNGTSKLYVPLGGDVQNVGNEVAVMSVGANSLVTTTRIRVGVRPQRVAVHPAGLVFVCNQYSNYISVIDPRTDQVLLHGNAPVEIKTEYFCSDLAFAPQNAVTNDPDHQFLYVANRWRHSVLKYRADVVRDAQNRPIDVQQTLVAGSTTPEAEILGVGNNPWRLSLSDQANAMYVANNKGGEVARIDLATDTVTGRVAINAPSLDVININDVLYVPTTMIDRGLLSDDLPVPPQVNSPPVTAVGLDGQTHQVHPGAMFDRTRSYNFEDLRNGVMQLDAFLSSTGNSFYYTDDVSSEPNFVNAQKVLSGALPQAVVRNAAGTLVYFANSGSDDIQEMQVNIGVRPNTLTPTGRSFKTQHRPFALAIDQPNNRLFVADWGSETVEQIDLGSGRSVAIADTGYANPVYPATNVEKGEFFFYNVGWSNNGRKSCASCHIDELDTDGVGFSNGAQAPTLYHQVKPNHNLMTTDAYFWNGSFGDGNYTSVAFAAQTRTNCELIELAEIEGPGSDPQGRVGDPNNVTANRNLDTQCRPVDGAPGELANAAQIAAVVAQEKKVADQRILDVSGLDREGLSRVIDAYSVSQLRLPPNPLRQMYDASAAGGAQQLDGQVMADIKTGKDLFSTAGCAGCHVPTDQRHPYADGLNHGSGADWISRFVSTYQADARITSTIGTFPETMLDAVLNSHADHEVNMWINPLDFFVPFCFSVQNCEQFDDPLEVRGGADESRRLDLIIKVNLQDPDRLFIPGDVVGQATVNTPSLRGVWGQANLLHHGLAHTVREAILGPGHPALGPGEVGWAMDSLGNFGVHGATQQLTADDVRALVRFVESIQ